MAFKEVSAVNLDNVYFDVADGTSTANVEINTYTLEGNFIENFSSTIVGATQETPADIKGSPLTGLPDWIMVHSDLPLRMEIGSSANPTDDSFYIPANVWVPVSGPGIEVYRTLMPTNAWRISRLQKLVIQPKASGKIVIARANIYKEMLNENEETLTVTADTNYDATDLFKTPFSASTFPAGAIIYTPVDMYISFCGDKTKTLEGSFRVPAYSSIPFGSMDEV